VAIDYDVFIKHGGGPTAHDWDRLCPWGMGWRR